MKRTFALISLAAILVAGCGKSGADVADDQKTNGKQTAKNGDHSGWWCAEHGVPEEECSMCSDTAAEKFRKDGDWCDEHSRAQSQCFKCDPSKAEKYAKLYEAKFGKEPPQPEE